MSRTCPACHGPLAASFRICPACGCRELNAAPAPSQREAAAAANPVYPSFAAATPAAAVAAPLPWETTARASARPFATFTPNPAPRSTAAAAAAPAAQAASSASPASLWRRFVAWTIDSLFVGALGVILIFAGEGLFVTLLDVVGIDNRIIVTLVQFLASTVLGCLYYAGTESSEWHATLGKRAMRLSVWRTDGQALTFGQAAGRAVMRTLMGFLVVVDPIVALANPRRQSLHDLTSSSIVIGTDE